MSEKKFEQVFRLQRDLFQTGSPVLIVAGDIIKDTATEKVWARLKFLNLDTREISAVKVRLIPYGVTDQPLASVEYAYLDLHEARNKEFGTKKAIPLPENSARSFTVESVEIVFSDKSQWESQGGWHTVFQRTALLNRMTAEQKEQYRRDTIPAAEYVPEAADDLWLCACGGVNHNGEDACSLCGCRKAVLLESLEEDPLNERLNTYTEAKAAEERAATKKKNRTIAIVVAIALVIIGLISYPNIQRQQLIEKAQQALAGKTFRGGKNNDMWYTFSADTPMMVQYSYLYADTMKERSYFRWKLVVFVTERDEEGNLVVLLKVPVDPYRYPKYSALEDITYGDEVTLRFDSSGEAYLEVESEYSSVKGKYYS